MTTNSTPSPEPMTPAPEMTEEEMREAVSRASEVKAELARVGSLVLPVAHSELLADAVLALSERVEALEKERDDREELLRQVRATRDALLTELCDVAGWEDRGIVHAVCHVRNLILNLRADASAARAENAALSEQVRESELDLKDARLIARDTTDRMIAYRGDRQKVIEELHAARSEVSALSEKLERAEREIERRKGWTEHLSRCTQCQSGLGSCDWGRELRKSL